MAAQNGRTLRISISNGGAPETFTAIAGAQEDTVSFEIGEIDITDKDDNGNRTLLAGGIKSYSASISGVTKTSDLAQIAEAGNLVRFQIKYQDTNETLTGNFQVGSYEDTGSNDNAAITFKAELRSSGAIVRA